MQKKEYPMLTTSRSLLQLAGFAGLLTACGSSGGLPDVTPSVAISSPTNNSSVNLSLTRKVAVNFNTNYTVKAPGTCEGADNCGHLYVLIDNSSCNGVAMSYNTVASSSPVEADFSKCATATGMHTITLELRHDDGSAVLNLVNKPVTAQVTVTAQ
jgi:hypothetical protein